MFLKINRSDILSGPFLAPDDKFVININQINQVIYEEFDNRSTFYLAYETENQMRLRGDWTNLDERLTKQKFSRDLNAVIAE